MPDPSPPQELSLRLIGRIADCDETAWDGLAEHAGARGNPFVRWGFLNALEQSGCVGGQSGWYPAHLIAQDANGHLCGAVPLYLKTNSQGEYVFDHAWAHAYESAGGTYYPKLQAAIPFTPVPGPRLLAPNNETRSILAASLKSAAIQHEAGSAHVTFMSQKDWPSLRKNGFCERHDVQYHFHNKGYDTYEDFLTSLASRKRKALRKERKRAQDGLRIVQLTGADLKEEHWAAFFDFYQDTGRRKWGQPYLNFDFFSRLHDLMADDILLIMAEENGQWIAGALNFIGDDTLYGRYWGRTVERLGLHFELCYHQAIDAALQRGLARVEAGAQGQHKLARGYEPVITRSAHWFADPGFHDAVAHYVDGERHNIQREVNALANLTPFKKE